MELLTLFRHKTITYEYSMNFHWFCCLHVAIHVRSAEKFNLCRIYILHVYTNRENGTNQERNIVIFSYSWFGK